MEYRPAGTGSWTAVTRSGTTASQSITGHTNGLRYEVRVAAFTATETTSSVYGFGLAGEVLDSDNFNRADTTTGTGSTSGGMVWTSATWRILSNQAKSPKVEGFATANAGIADFTLSATFVAVPALSQGLLLRYTDTNNWIGLVRSSAGNWVIQKRSSGAYTTLVDSGLPAQSGDRLTLKALGSNFTLHVNNNAPVTGTDGTRLVQTLIALRGQSSTAVDDLVISAA